MRRSVLAALSCCITILAAAQITKQDYERAVSFMWRHLDNKVVFNASVDPVWFRDSSAVAYVLHSKDSATYYKMSLKQRQQTLLFDHRQLAQALSELLRRKVQDHQLPVGNLVIHHQDLLEFNTGGKTYLLQLPSYSLTEKIIEKNNHLERTSPDGKWIAYTENYNLHLRHTETGEKKQLSTAGFKDFEYGTWYGWSDIMEGENGIRPPRFGVEWSPDSKWIQTFICDLRSGDKMYLLDWSIDTLYRPKLLSYYRASPGDTGMVYMTPVFFHIETGREIRREQARTTHTFPARYEWTSKPGIAIEQVMKRGFQEAVVNELDVINGKERRLYHETSKTNIDNLRISRIEEWNHLLVLSDRDGWRQLYAVDAASAALKPVTNGAYYITDIAAIDKVNKQIYFRAQGKEQERNPYLHHLYRIGLDGKGLTLLTPEHAHHDVLFSPDRKFFIDNYSAYNQPTVTVLRATTDGRVLHTISRASVSGLLQKGFTYPELFTTLARDGQTTIYGTIWKPSHFDPSKKYPVIDASYTGPHTNQFPRDFISGVSRSGNQSLAELGFVVVTIDGMGTAGRSKAFQSVSYKNMGQNLLDHVLFIRAMGSKYAWADTARVGIFGHSAGGYDAGHALLEFGDFYKVGVASSADHDFRMEKDWWPEMYMGWPVDSTYHWVSNITMAPRLKGKLLITHGGIDENVNPSATFKLAEALIRADKPFDMLILPSQRHGYAGKFGAYFTKRRWNYFVEHLLGEKPVWDFSFDP